MSLFTLRRDASESYRTYARCVWQSIVFICIHLFCTELFRHKSSKINKYNQIYIYIYILTIIHIFRFTKEVWLQISCSWPPTLWLALLRVPWKKRPDPALMSKVSRFLPLTSFNWDALSAFDLTLQDHTTSMCPCEKCSEVIAPGQGVPKRSVTASHKVIAR